MTQEEKDKVIQDLNWRNCKMGCDIHCYIEHQKNNQWEYIKYLDINRSYQLFAILANVRNFDNKIIPISPAKGLPKNISQTTKVKAEDWGRDAHSHSCLTLFEILNAKTSEQSDYLMKTIVPQLLKIDSDWHKTRIVFWFDN